jgi:hypothetical protein
MKTLTIAVLLSALLGSFGCTADFDPGSRVTSFRVLAQQVDTPFAKPGETVQVSSLSHDPEGRAVNWAWAVCVNPASSTVQGCLDKIAEDSAKSGNSPILAQGLDLSDFSYTIPEDALTALPPDTQASALVGVMSVACPGDLSFDGGPNNLPWSCKERGTGRVLGQDEFVVGSKRVLVRAIDRNQNPSIEQVTFDGQDWPEGEVKQVTACDTTSNDYAPCAADTKHRVAARPSRASVESGNTEFGVPFTEQVIIDYYATEGTFEYDVKIAGDSETGWAARAAARGKDVTLWMVVHDDRGGATWAERHVHVE